MLRVLARAFFVFFWVSSLLNLIIWKSSEKHIGIYMIYIYIYIGAVSIGLKNENVKK